MVASVPIVDRDKVLKCWRIADYKKNMPWFSEDLMKSIETFCGSVKLGVTAELFNCENCWEIHMAVAGKPVTRCNSTIVMSKTPEGVEPNITVIANFGEFTLRIKNCDIHSCFSVAAAAIADVNINTRSTIKVGAIGR